MRQYRINIVEKRLSTIAIEASSKEKAEAIANEQYHNGNLDLKYLWHEVEFQPVIGVKLNDKCLKKAISVEQSESFVTLKYKKYKHLDKAIDHIDENNWTYNTEGLTLKIYPIL